VLFAAPAAQATPVTYNFTVAFPDDPLFGPLAGAGDETGSFTFDSSIIMTGSVTGLNLLTDLDFWHNGIHYDETTANTGSVGYLTFDAGGNLVGMNFGNDCRVEWASCSAAPMTNGWAATSCCGGFVYGTPDTGSVWWGELAYALVPYVPPVSVPEPGALGIMTAGLGLLTVMYRRRRLL
jgi:hypothetical protein